MPKKRLLLFLFIIAALSVVQLPFRHNILVKYDNSLCSWHRDSQFERNSLRTQLILDGVVPFRNQRP